MNTLEISTITIIHSLSQLTPKDLDLLEMMARGKTLTEIAQLREVELSQMEEKIASILKIFGLANLSDLLTILREINLPDLLKQK